MCSLCTLPLYHYEDHYQSNVRIPTLNLGDNAADLNKKPIQIQRQTLRTEPPHCIAMGTKMSVAFSVIFAAYVEKQLLYESHFSGRDLLMTYSQCGLFLKPKSTTLLIFRELFPLNNKTYPRQNRF